jgi:hypothetical protein
MKFCPIHLHTVNFSAPADTLNHIQELAKQSPWNNGTVTLGIAYDGFSPSDPLSPDVIAVARSV